MADKNVVIAGKEEFKALCVEVLPHLNAIQEALKKNQTGGEDESASITVGKDGYLSFHVYGQKWKMNRFSCDGKARIKYEYTDEIELPE